MNFENLIGRRVHAQFAQPAQVYLGPQFQAGSVRAEAAEGIVTAVESGFLTLEADAVFSREYEGDTVDDEGFIGMRGCSVEVTLMHPLKQLGTLQVMQ